LALQAFPASSNSRSPFRRTRIDHLIFEITAFRTSHPNCGQLTPQDIVVCPGKNTKKSFLGIQHTP
jgi:hypothetical protein